MFRISGVYIYVTGIQKNKLWLGWLVAWVELSLSRQNSTVFTNCLQLYECMGAQRDLILKIILLFFVCMYSVYFIATLDGAILATLIIHPCSFFAVYGGRGDFPWDSTRMLAANLCVMCFLCYVQSVYVLIFSSRLRRDNAPDGRGRVSVVSSLSIAGDITRVCYVLLLHLSILVLVLFGKIVATQFLPYQFGQYPRLLPIFLENL